MFIFGLVGCCATIRESKLGLGFVSVCWCVRQEAQAVDIQMFSRLVPFLLFSVLSDHHVDLRSWSCCFGIWLYLQRKGEASKMCCLCIYQSILFSILLYIMWHFSPLQISDDLDRSMNEVFMKYDGESAESSAADYLQTQVCCSWYPLPAPVAFVFTSLFCTFKSRVPQSCVVCLLCLVF